MGTSSAGFSSVASSPSSSSMPPSVTAQAAATRSAQLHLGRELRQATDEADVVGQLEQWVELLVRLQRPVLRSPVRRGGCAASGRRVVRSAGTASAGDRPRSARPRHVHRPTRWSTAGAPASRHRGSRTAAGCGDRRGWHARCHRPAGPCSGGCRSRLAGSCAPAASPAGPAHAADAASSRAVSCGALGRRAAVRGRPTPAARAAAYRRCRRCRCGSPRPQPGHSTQATAEGMVPTQHLPADPHVRAPLCRAARRPRRPCAARPGR